MWTCAWASSIIYLAYEQLTVDENSVHSCIRIAGAQDAQHITGVVMFPMFNIGSCFFFSKGLWNLKSRFDLLCFRNLSCDLCQIFHFLGLTG